MKICIITPEAVGPFGNGGVGTHCTNLAAFLATKLGGGVVTLLYTGRIDRENLKYWQAHYARKYDVRLEWIDIDPIKRDVSPKSVGLKTHDDLMSQAVLEFLTAHHFDVCFFQDMLGGGFRSIQAKRNGVALRDSLLTCTVHSSTNWVHEAMKMQPIYGVSETLTKYIERYSVEHCDVLISPSQYMLDWSAKEIGHPHAAQHVVPYLSNAQLKPAGMRPPANKLIFFGRLEQRKGFVVFLEAILVLLRENKVPKPLEIHLLGKNGFTTDGGAKLTLAKYRERFDEQVKFVSVNDLGHDEALEYLATHNDAVVVCPSVIDNSPNAIIEALQLGVNLVSCAAGGIPELFADQERLCAPEPPALAALLERALGGQLPPVAASYSPAKAEAAWTALVESFRQPQPPAPLREAPARVTVIIPGPARNPDHEKQHAALAAQTFKDFDIVEALLPSDLRSVPRENATILLPAGCIPRPDALQTVVNAMRHSECEAFMGWAMLTRYTGYEPVFFRPFGPVHEAAIYGNTLGTGLLALRPGVRLEGKYAAQYLFVPRATWQSLVQLIAVGELSFDVIPTVISDNTTPPFWLSASARTYDAQMEVVGLLTENLRPWQKRILESAAGTELRFASLRSAPKGAVVTPTPDDDHASFFTKLGRQLHELQILPSMKQTEIFPAIEDELAPFKKYFTGNVLNAGAGDRDISHFIEGKLWNQDIPEGGHTDQIHIYSPLHKIPREDGFFDAIICNAVMEHVRNPEEVMAEFRRVCKRGGYLFLAIPFMQPEHKDPTDFQRYTEDGIAELARRHGFEPIQVDGIHSVYTTMAWICRNWLNSRKSISYFLLKALLFPYLKWKVKSSRFQVNSLQSAYRLLAQKVED